MSRGSLRWRIAIAAVAAVVLAAVAVRTSVGGRGAAPGGDDDDAVTAPQRVSIVAGEPVVTLDAAAQRDTGMATVTLHPEQHQPEIRAWASVLDPQPLTELAGRQASARAQLDIARAKLAATAAAFERSQKLYKDRQNVSAAELQAAEAAFRVDQAGLAAAQAQLRAVAAMAQQGWGPVLGQALADGAELLQRLGAGQEVLLQVTLRPGQRPAQPGDAAAVQLDGGARLPLRFLSAATRTDPRLQGPSCFYAAPGGSGLLPGMSLVALLANGTPMVGLVVPRQAIVWGDGRAWAYFRTGADTFARRAVATDVPIPGGGYIVSGLADDVDVVIVGAQMLFSEEFRARLPGTAE